MDSKQQTAMVSTKVMIGAAPSKAFSSAGATIAGVAVDAGDRLVPTSVTSSSF
jgi:hypothetical protein